MGAMLLSFCQNLNCVILGGFSRTKVC